MTILDAEYQFDRHKLTFYFEADRRIDFRELVSELFSQYKTRIWMQQVDTSAPCYQDAGLELAKATGFLPDRESYNPVGRNEVYQQLDYCGRDLTENIWDPIAQSQKESKFHADFTCWESVQGVQARPHLPRY